MEQLLLWIARTLGLIGSVLCTTSVIARLGGMHLVASFQVGTLLLAGIAAWSLASLVYLAVLVEVRRS